MAKRSMLNMLLTVFTMSVLGCATVPPVVRPQAPAEEKWPEVLPFNPGDIPAGWAFNGMRGPLVVEFARADRDAAVQFTFYPAQHRTPAEVMKKAMDQASGGSLVFVEVTYSEDGNEAVAKIKDESHGSKAGRLIIRRFPGWSAYGVIIAGLWPATAEGEVLPDFETMQAWGRLKPVKAP
jgi:hypothetical protein